MEKLKRNAEMNKRYKRMLKDLDAMFGEADAGLLLSILIKTLRKLGGDKESVELRTLKITVNGYFEEEWDFTKNDFSDKGGDPE